MGTRHLVAVQVDGEYKVAQYGQWDGYPDGQGLRVLNFVRGMDRVAFADKCRACRWLTEAEIEDMNKTVRETGIRLPAHITRDAGAKILGLIAKSDGLALSNRIDFAGDSLFCEWAYVVDLDKGALEVFGGFNKEPVSPGERFADAKVEPDSEYTPVRFLRAWSLEDLPSDEVFVRELDPPEDDDDA